METNEAAANRWASFLETRNDGDREWLIEFYAPMVETVRRGFRNVRAQDRDDLDGAGYVGLIRSVDQWNPEKMPWLEFARFRIRAAMVDHIREASWVPKSVRSVAKRIEAREERLASKLGRMPTPAELAQDMGIPVEEVEGTLTAIRGTDWTVASLDYTQEGEGSWLDALADPFAETPESTMVRRDDLDALELVLQRLPTRLRKILRWRYFDYPRKSQKEIAQELQIHESRVSQLLDVAYDQARRLSLQPWVLFPEVLEEEGRMTCRD